MSSDLTINRTHTNAGSYSDTWSFTDPTGNYAPETGAMTNTIGQATATVSVTPISGLVYNGGPLETASYSATGVGGVSLPSTDFTNTTVHTNAGTYNDTWTFTDPNYVSQTGSVTDNIGQATATVVVTPTPGLVYNGGSQQTASYSATGVGGASLPSTDFTDTTVHTNAGTYHDTWTFTDPNYVSQTGSVTDNIAQATATIVVTPTPGLIYSGSPQVTATGVADGVNGPLPMGDLTINSTHTNAGTYSDSWSFTDPRGNYKTTSGTMVESIGQATATVSVTPISGLVYNGGLLETASYSATGVNGALRSSDFTETTAHTNAGTYNDTWTFTDPNYVSQTGSVTGHIAQATATIVVTPTPGLIYNGGPQVTATGTATGVGGVNLSSDLTINSTHTNAGSYSDTWSFTDPTGNYAPETGAMTDTIGQANASVIITPYSVTYDGNAHTVSGTVNGVGDVNLPASDLNLIATTHTNVGTYTDSWTFSDPNYVSQHGTVQDVIINPIRPPIALVTTLYQEILGRTPDQGGLTCWVNAVNSGSTITQIATSFWNSSEHKANPIGNLTTASHDASNAFVNTLYQDMLGRTGDTGGVASWDQVLDSNSATPNQVAMDFWNSSEHQAKLKAGTAPASTYSISVTALYNELLGRSPRY